jgi:hypothetical protein
MHGEGNILSFRQTTYLGPELTIGKAVDGSASRGPKGICSSLTECSNSGNLILVANLARMAERTTSNLIVNVILAQGRRKKRERTAAYVRGRHYAP